MKKYLYKIEYATENFKPVIYLFGRNEKKEKIIMKETNFKPYFYANIDAEIPKHHNIIKVEEGYKNLFNQDVLKVTYKHPRNSYEIRDLFEETFEDDILFDLRYMIDKLDELKKQNIEFIGGFNKWRTCMIDIETTTEFGFPNSSNAIEQITTVTYHDSYTNKYYTYVWRKDLETKKIEKNNWDIYLFNDEKDMLKKILSDFPKFQFDIVTAWNVSFDVPYLIKRLEYLNINTNILSPIKKVYVREGGIGDQKKYFDAVIGGIVVIDLLDIYRKTHKGELRSYSLKNVGIDEKIAEKNIINTHTTWSSSDINDIVGYNKLDVEIIVKLNEKRRLINFVNSICDVAKVNMEDVKFYSRVSDTLCLRYAKRNNIVLPSKRKLNKEGSSYEGGYVFSDPGLYENVISLDFTTLYPNILKTFNLSLDTLDDKGDVDALVVKTNSNIKGVIPSVVDELINLRKTYKKNMMNSKFGSDEYYVLDALQQATKNLYCVLGYGVNALSSFRLYDKRVAESITMIGRELLKLSIKKIEQEGYKVVANDTDSLYLVLGNKQNTLQKIIDEGNRLVQLLNEEYNKYCNSKGCKESTIEIKFEKIYKRFLTVTKKRWAGYLLWREGKLDEGIDIAGLHSRRSDVSLFSKTFQKIFIEKLLKGETKENIISYIKNEYKKFKNLEYDFEFIAIPAKLNKDISEYKVNTPMTRGVKYSEKKLGVRFKSGDKFLMLYCVDFGYDVICFEYNEQLKEIDIPNVINMPKMLDRSIIKPLDSIFNALNWQDDLIRIKTAQSSIYDFQKHKI